MRNIREILLVLATVGLVACAESAAPSGGVRGSTLSVVAVRGSKDSAGDAVDSVDIIVRRADSTVAGHGAAFFPPGVDTVPVVVQLTVTSDVETLTLTMALLANGTVVYTSTSTITVHRGESNRAPGVQPAVWSLLSPAVGPAPRIGAGLAFDAYRGRLVMFGGFVLGQPQTDTWEFDRTSGWQLMLTTASPPGRAAHVMAYDPVRKVVVIFGGASGDGTLNDTWTYNGATQTWTSVNATGPVARAGASAAFDVGRGATGALVMFGGANVDSALSDTWQFDGAAWTKITADSSPTKRVFHGMAYDAARARIELVGGYDTHSVLSDRWVLSAAGLGWRREVTAGNPGPRAGHVLAYDATLARLVLYGGTDSDSLRHDTWVFDGTWHTPSPAVTKHPRSSVGIGAAFYPGIGGVGIDRLIAFGGFDGDVANNETWSIGTDWAKETDLSGQPATREQAALALFPGHGAVLFGGSGGAADTWLYVNDGWVQLRSAGGPGPRQGAAMAFDGTKVVLFGGRSTTLAPSGDTWLFDGRTWTKSAATGPAPRVNHSLVYDPVRHRLVLFGGQDNTTSFGDTWLWDGSGWTQAASTGPAPRSGATMVFDPQRGVILFGGSAGTGTFFADTWVWSATQWTQLPTSGAIPARRDAGGVFDTDRGRLVVVGGQGEGPSTPLLDDVWELADNVWSLVPLGAGASRPAARTGAVMLYRGTGLGSIYFGGRSVTGSLNDLWSIR